MLFCVIGHVYCNGTTDTFGGCWNLTRAGNTAEIPCPDLMGSSSYGLTYGEVICFASISYINDVLKLLYNNNIQLWPS